MFVRLLFAAGAFAAVSAAAATQCTMQCGPDTTACGPCQNGTCTTVNGLSEFKIDFDRVALCATGYFATTYPLCMNLSITTDAPVRYTCTKDPRQIRDSRVLQYAARQLRLAYAISPILSACKHSCADVGLTFGSRDAELNTVCGDCVPSGALVVGSSEIVAIRPTTTDIRSAAVWGRSSFKQADLSLLQGREATVAQEAAYEGRRVYLCPDSSSRGRSACLRELRARELTDSSLLCFDGLQAIPCPSGGDGHVAIEWAGRVVAGIAVLLLIASLHWWVIPVVQLSVAMLTWCNDASPLHRAVYEGMDIILLKWDFTSSCPDGITLNGCEVANVAISSGILIVAVLIVAIVTHTLSWAAGGRDGETNNYGSGMGGRIASRTFRLTGGGAVALWFSICMVPLCHFGSGIVFSQEVDDYSAGGYWMFALLGIVMMAAMIVICFAICGVSVAAAARVSREVRGLPSNDTSSAPVVAQTPYGEVVSAVGGYSPLYRAYVTHVHGPASLVSATSALWNSGWWSWFPSGEPLAWSTNEGFYDGDGLLARQCVSVFNSFNPSNIIFGGFVYAMCIAGAIISGIECFYVNENLNCCVVRAALLLGFVTVILVVFMLRRPLLGDNILPALLLFMCFATWVLYLIFISADTADEVSPQVTIVCLLFVIMGTAILLSALHGVIRFTHVVMSDGAVPAVSTVAVNMNDRKSVAMLNGMEPGASYIATTQQQGGLVSVPTFYGDGKFNPNDQSNMEGSRPGTVVGEGIPAPSQTQHPLAGSVVGSQNGRSSPVYYPHPQQVQQTGPPQPEMPKDGNWLYTDGDEWPVESSYTIISQQ